MDPEEMEPLANKNQMVLLNIKKEVLTALEYCKSYLPRRFGDQFSLEAYKSIELILGENIDKVSNEIQTMECDIPKPTIVYN